MRLLRLAVVSLTLAGCGGGSNPADLGGGDLAMKAADLSGGGGADLTTPPDLAMASGDMAHSAAAKYFCDGFMQICGFSAMYYADYDTCLAAYDSYSVNREMCVGNELGMAAMDKAHCVGASGGVPCDKN
jgi:hypothetical protein